MEDRGDHGVADDNPSADDLGGVDVSGNCDEAEHARGPECQGTATGLAPIADDDGIADGDSDGLDDDSGPSVNSGPGSVSSGSGSSGGGSSGPGSGHGY